jgi:hypothetical protein
MSIRITKYDRGQLGSKDHATAIEWKDGWLVRCTQGPTWFYNLATDSWVISHSLETPEFSNLALPLEKALEVLEKVTTVKQRDDARETLRAPAPI